MIKFQKEIWSLLASGPVTKLNSIALQLFYLPHNLGIGGSNLTINFSLQMHIYVDLVMVYSKSIINFLSF